MEEFLECKGCGKLYWPCSAKQTHYCSSRCGDRVRNDRKRDRRLTLRKNIEILDALKIPVGYSLVVDINELYARDFNPEVFTERVDVLLPDGITQAVKIYMERYLIYNHQNKITIQHL
jgi:hypothetical protein